MENNRFGNAPLSKRMMPLKLADFVGQGHLTGKGKPVETMVGSKILHSMIFYGPPATGKTSLAEIIARELDYRFVNCNALTLDSDEIKKILKEAREVSLLQKRTLVFIDEIHRLIKPKQDAFLSALERGEITLIGATTENPYFIIQPAFRSRVFIYEFKAHTNAELRQILMRALQHDEAMKRLSVSLNPEAEAFLLGLSPDARVMLNTLEMAALSKPLSDTVVLEKADIETIVQKADSKYSSKEGHYDIISAFIKSVRGSDVDAALYYLAFMLHSGEDPLFIARRLIILAAEDIGLAYPEGLAAAVSSLQALQFIGMPEGQLVLSMTTALLAGVPKSNSTTMAIFKAKEDIAAGNIMAVPPHLREAGFTGAEELKRGIGYQYPHDYPNHYVAQKYTEKVVEYYNAGQLGFERKIADWLAKLRQGDNKAGKSEQDVKSEQSR